MTGPIPAGSPGLVLAAIRETLGLPRDCTDQAVLQPFAEERRKLEAAIEATRPHITHERHTPWPNSI